MENLKTFILKEIENTLNYDRNAGLYGTQILNAEGAIGKYHGLMDVLEKIDLDLFVKTHEEKKPVIDELFATTERIYEMRR